MEIVRLSGEGWNVSEIAKQMNSDWKTVKRCLSQHSEKKIGVPLKESNHQDENELTKVIFRKLNAGIPPVKIAEEDGHVDLVESLCQKRKRLRGLGESDSSLPDPQMLESFEAWENSLEKHQDWHLGRAIRALGKNGYQMMMICLNHKNRGVECYQIESDDPYRCVGCQFFSD